VTKVLDYVFPLTQLAELARKHGSKANESEESCRDERHYQVRHTGQSDS
jgi:hypothetical protein